MSALVATVNNPKAENATEKLTEDLEYLCSLVEKPDPEFTIKNAIDWKKFTSGVI